MKELTQEEMLNVSGGKTIAREFIDHVVNEHHRREVDRKERAKEARERPDRPEPRGNTRS